MPLLIRVTLYAEFLPMKSRATCILLIEVWTTLHYSCIIHLERVLMAFRNDKNVHSSETLCFGSRILYHLDFALQIFWALGTVFEVLLAILVMPTLGWRWLLGLSTIPLFIFAILCFVSMMLSVLLYNIKSSLLSHTQSYAVQRIVNSE